MRSGDRGLNCLYPGRFWKIFDENVREKPNRKKSKPRMITLGVPYKHPHEETQSMEQRAQHHKQNHILISPCKFTLKPEGVQGKQYSNRHYTQYLTVNEAE